MPDRQGKGATATNSNDLFVQSRPYADKEHGHMPHLALQPHLFSVNLTGSTGQNIQEGNISEMTLLQRGT